MDIGKLTLEQKIMQTEIALIEKGKKLKYVPGAVFFFGQIITEADETGINELRGYISEICDRADIPPLITSDFENGCGSMVKGLTPLPYLMGLGATDDEQLAYDYGKATALEACSIGANWTFSPVVDLNINRRNPLINVRALTDNAELAAKMAVQLVHGMQENGLSACAKHFPGDGVDYRDQHIVTTDNSLSREEWTNTYGKVYKEMINCGADTIMAGHISFSAYENVRDKEFNMAYPATLSSELIETLLKKEMGFEGVVVTDALNMGGISGYYKDREQTEIEAFKAGCDMLLWPTENYLQNMKKAVESGYISMERLDDAVRRIMTLKEKRGLFDKNKPLFRNISNEERLFIKSTQARISKCGMTVVRNKNNILPVDAKSVKKLLLVPVINHTPSFVLAELLRDRLAERIEKVEYMPKVESERFSELAQKADIILFAMFSRSFRPQGFLDYYADAAAALQTAFSVGKDKTVGVSFGSPYFFKQYFPRANAFVNAYSMLECQVEAFVKAFFGEEDFGIYSPVDL